MKAGAADTKGAAAGKRNRSALVDVTNRGITTRSSARAAQDKVGQKFPILNCLQRPGGTISPLSWNRLCNAADLITCK
jgi:hypothetical protein